MNRHPPSSPPFPPPPLSRSSPAAAADDPLPGRDGNYQLAGTENVEGTVWKGETTPGAVFIVRFECGGTLCYTRSEEHTSELQSQSKLVCRLLLEKKKYSINP